MGMRGSGDRIELIYFQHQIFDFFFIFFGSYMYVNFGNFLLIIFTISKIDFTIKKPILGRKPGNRNFRKSQPVGLVIASETPLWSRVRRPWIKPGCDRWTYIWPGSQKPNWYVAKKPAARLSSGPASRSWGSQRVTDLQCMVIWSTCYDRPFFSNSRTALVVPPMDNLYYRFLVIPFMDSPCILRIAPVSPYICRCMGMFLKSVSSHWVFRSLRRLYRHVLQWHLF